MEQNFNQLPNYMRFKLKLLCWYLGNIYSCLNFLLWRISTSTITLKHRTKFKVNIGHRGLCGSFHLNINSFPHTTWRLQHRRGYKLLARFRNFFHFPSFSIYVHFMFVQTKIMQRSWATFSFEHLFAFNAFNIIIDSTINYRM